MKMQSQPDSSVNALPPYMKSPTDLPPARRVRVKEKKAKRFHNQATPSRQRQTVKLLSSKGKRKKFLTPQMKVGLATFSSVFFLFLIFLEFANIV